MKIIISIFLSSAFIYSFAQNKWDKIEDDLWKQYKEEKISFDEYFIRVQKEAGHIGNDIALWGKKISKIKNPDNKVSLMFTGKIRKEGNMTIRREMILANGTKKPLKIESIDSAIDGVQEYFHINSKWKPYRKNGVSACGNSYFEKSLAPFHKMTLHLDNNIYDEGEKVVDYKIIIKINGHTYESNVIKVKLLENQYKRIKENTDKGIIPERIPR